MILIDGKKAAAELREELKQEVAELKTKYNKVPGLTVILIGDMAPSQIYVRNKEKSANEVGLKSEVIRYPDTVEEKTVLEKIEELKQEVAELKTKYNKVPGLTVILIGDMAPSQIYVRNKEKSANEVGLKSEVIKYPDTVEEKTVLEKIEELNND